MDVDRAEYERLLRNAYDRGRRDGRAAAPSEQRRPCTPPPGLPLNGPRWYTAGFRAGLAEQAAAAAVPAPRREASPADVPARAG